MTENSALAAQSPAEIDAVLAALGAALAQAADAAENARDRIAKMRASTMGVEYYAEKIAQAEKFGAAQAALARQLAEQLVPYDAEFDARGGWSRYYLVNANNGHVHYDVSSYRCSRQPTTDHFWLTSESGKTAEQVVELAGERACTVCFPWAPVETLNRPTQYFTPNEQEKAEARKARADKAAAKAAKIAAAAIAHPDGEPLLDQIDWVIKTEAAAKQAYMRAAEDVAYYGDVAENAKDRPANYDPAEWEQNRLWNLGRYDKVAVRALEALAFKHGVSVEAERAVHAKKLDAKIRARRREAEQYRAQFRAMSN